MRLASCKKLSFWGAVASIIGIPLALALYWAPQTAAGGDTFNVKSSNQKGGITAYQVNITPQPGQLNESLVYPDKEMLEIQLRTLTNAIQDMQGAYNRCKKIASAAEQCQSILHGIETQTALRNKFCKDNQVSQGDYGCP